MKRRCFYSFIYTHNVFSNDQTQTGIHWDYDFIKSSFPQRGEEEDASETVCVSFSKLNTRVGYKTTWWLTALLSMALSREEGAGWQVDRSFISPPVSPLNQPVVCF